MSKEFEELTDEAIANIRKDRQQTQELLKDLVKYLAEDNHRHKEVGLTAAKYVETLQRSNEQLVKIVGIKSKNEAKDVGLTQEERDEIFGQLNEEQKVGIYDFGFGKLNAVEKPSVGRPYDGNSFFSTLRKAAEKVFQYNAFENQGVIYAICLRVEPTKFPTPRS